MEANLSVITGIVNVLLFVFAASTFINFIICVGNASEEHGDPAIGVYSAIYALLSPVFFFMMVIIKIYLP